MRFAVLGCGNIALRSVIPAIVKSTKAELVVCIDINPAVEEVIVNNYKCKFCHSLKKAIEGFDFDALYISTPISVHKDAIFEAAKNKKHVLCEKSIVVSLVDAYEVVKICRENEVALFEGFMYQFHEQHRHVAQLINNEIIGTPFHFQAWFGFPPISSNDFRYKKLMGGGAVLDAGSYTIHSARHFFNCEPEKVYSILEYENHEVEIRGTLMLDFGNSRTAHLVFGFDNMYQNRYEIWGTKGKVTLDRAFGISPSFCSTLVIEKQDSVEKIPLPACDHFVAELDYFSEHAFNLEQRFFWESEIINQAKVIDAVFKNSKR